MGNNEVSCDNLTIIIPSFQRQQYVKRQIEYWSRFNVRIEILDGSPNSIFEKSEKTIGSIRYWHLPVSIEERLKFSVGLVDTEYAALLSDDEFFIPSACDSCIQFLEMNPDFGSCKGQALGFYWDKIVVSKNIYRGLHGYKVVADKGEERMIEHMCNYEMATLWSVQRSKVFKAALSALGEGSIYSTAAAGEAQISLVSAFLGKVKVFDELMWLRSFENENIWWSYGDLSLKDWWLDDRFGLEHKSFIRSICDGIQFVCSSPPEDVLIKEAMDRYCLESRSNTNIFMTVIRPILPLWLRKIIRLSI